MPRLRRPRTRPARAAAAIAVAAVGLTLSAGTAGAVGVRGDDPRPGSSPTATPSPVVPRPVPLAPAFAVVGGGRLGSSGVVYDDTLAAPPKLEAATWLLADLDTGQVLAARAAHVHRPPASTLKALTALTLAPRLDPDGTYTATQADANVIGSKVGVVPDQTYDVSDLWLGLFLPSGNDAANALANAAGGVPETVNWMQREARRLQAFDTTVANPSGLDAPGQLTSAYDLALIGRAALDRADIREYADTESATFPGNHTDTATAATRKAFQIGNQNALLGNYPGAFGLKTGYTTKARHTLIGAAERDGHALIVTLMGVPHPYVSREAGALLDWGFAHAGDADPVGQLVEPSAPAEVGDGDGEPVDGPDPALAQGLGADPTGEPDDSFGSVPILAGAAAMTLAGAGLGLQRRRTRRRPAHRR